MYRLYEALSSSPIIDCYFSSSTILDCYLLLWGGGGSTQGMPFVYASTRSPGRMTATEAGGGIGRVTLESQACSC